MSNPFDATGLIADAKKAMSESKTEENPIKEQQLLNAAGLSLSFLEDQVRELRTELKELSER